MKKNFGKLMALALAGISVGSMAACGGKKGGGGVDELQIFVSHYGYGVDWVDDIIEAFKQESWVKEKYEKAGRTISIAIPVSDRERSLPIKYIEGGYTNYDLIFSCDLGTKLEDKMGSKILYEDLTSLWQTTIPGESVTVEKKMKASFVDSADRDMSEGVMYKEFPWVGGTYGFVYNKYLVDKYLGADYEMPKTTYELVEMGNALNATTGAPKLVLANKEASYWSGGAFQLFWGQYSGEEKLWNYHKGQDANGNYTVEALKDQGRLRALEAIEEILVRTDATSGKYVNLSSYYKAYGVAQGDFLRGKGVMMAMGDWFDLEMEAFKSDPNNAAYIDPNTDIRWMRNPILSAMVETLDLYTAGKEYSALTDEEKAFWDAKLVAIIDAVDAGATSLEGVSAGDFNKVQAARGCKTVLGGHVAYIPGYADATELAKDFLLFMASDKGIETFMKSTDGCSTAFNYSVDKNSELWNGFSEMQKKKIQEDEISSSWYVGRGYTTKLTFTGLFSGSYAFGETKNKTLESMFCSETASDRMSSLSIYESAYNYFSANNNRQWNNLLLEAGVSN